jgi:hypothetical protein
MIEDSLERGRMAAWNYKTRARAPASAAPAGSLASSKLSG